jgi:N4-gp56 family major capsid protein
MGINKNMHTTTRINHPINIFYQSQVLLRVIDAFIYVRFGKSDSMPQHVGDVNKWRRWANPLAQTVPLIEGIDPAPILLSKTDIQVRIKEYGAYIVTSSWMTFTGLTEDQIQMNDILLDNMRLTLDTLTRDVASGTASQTTASNGTGTATFINKTDLDIIVTNLLSQNTRMIKGQVNAGVNQGTSPIRAAFIGICHVGQRNKLEAVSGFKHVANYAKPGEIMPDEFGSTNDIRWLLTTNATRATSTTGYENLIFGQEFYGTVKITGNSADAPLIFTPKDRTGSPLQRFTTLGWLKNFAAEILNDNFGHVLVTTV